eukprot:4096244-Alexandrium_andersonii.AAC.1
MRFARVDPPQDFLSHALTGNPQAAAWCMRMRSACVIPQDTHHTNVCCGLYAGPVMFQGQALRVCSAARAGHVGTLPRLSNWLCRVRVGICMDMPH